MKCKHECSIPDSVVDGLPAYQGREVCADCAYAAGYHAALEAVRASLQARGRSSIGLGLARLAHNVSCESGLGLASVKPRKG